MENIHPMWQTRFLEKTFLNYTDYAVVPNRKRNIVTTRKKKSFFRKSHNHYYPWEPNNTPNEIINLLHNNLRRKRKGSTSLENSSCTSSHLVAKRNSHTDEKEIKKEKESFEKGRVQRSNHFPLGTIRIRSAWTWLRRNRNRSIPRAAIRGAALFNNEQNDPWKGWWTYGERGKTSKAEVSSKPVIQRWASLSDRSLVAPSPSGATEGDSFSSSPFSGLRLFLFLSVYPCVPFAHLPPIPPFTRPSYPYTGIRSLKPPRQKAKPAPPPCVRAASSSSFFHPVPPPPPPPPPLQPSYQRPVDDRRPSSSPPPWLGQGPNGRLFQTMLSMRFSKPILLERADFAFAILSFFFPIVNNWLFIWIVIFRDDDFTLSVTVSSVISSFFFFVDRNFWLR